LIPQRRVSAALRNFGSCMSVSALVTYWVWNDLNYICVNFVDCNYGSILCETHIFMSAVCELVTGPMLCGTVAYDVDDVHGLEADKKTTDSAKYVLLPVLLHFVHHLYSVLHCAQFSLQIVFTARCPIYIAQCCDSKSSVCPSALLSVTLCYSRHIIWVTSKIIIRKISWVSLLLGGPTSAIKSKGNTPKFGWNRGGSLFSAEKMQYLWDEAR